MELKGKALYNLLRMSATDRPELEIQEWQVEDLRPLSTKNLFRRLSSLKLPLDEKSFSLYAQEVETPEDLLECVWIEENNPEQRDQAYLLLFELWRRLLSDKRSISLFCDELDHLIDSYDKDSLEEEEQLDQALSFLEDILDDACDMQGLAPSEAFDEISKYCAHDLEVFIYDYCLEQLENKDAIFASELLDAFYEYVSDKKWFDFLRARLFYSTESEEGNKLIERLLDQLKEEPDVDLLMQIIQSLVHYGDLHLFPLAISQTFPELQTEKEYQELLSHVADYYRFLDREAEEGKVRALLKQRAKRALDNPIDEAAREQWDSLIKEFTSIKPE
ncbi:MAG TPA: hypothetical protein VGJ00_03655 [Rhabdochlamydiaceae bacterium]|jgi:hypothetical protein